MIDRVDLTYWTAKRDSNASDELDERWKLASITPSQKSKCQLLEFGVKLKVGYAATCGLRP